MQCVYCTFVMADPPGPSCPNCGNATMPPGYGNPGMPSTYGPLPTPARLSGLSVAATILFICVAVTQLLIAVVRHSTVSANAKDTLAVISGLALLALILVFLVWFYKARRNAGLWGRQRHGQGWSIGAWFTPVVALWFPYQILDDVWRASEPATAARRGPDAVAKAWWACWLLAWLSGVSIKNSTTTLPDGTTNQTSGFNVYLGGTIVSNLFTAAAAVLGLLVVGRVTRMQEAHRPTA